MKSEEEEFARIEGFECGRGRWTPEVNLIDIPARGVKLVPVFVRDADKYTHLALRITVYIYSQEVPEARRARRTALVSRNAAVSEFPARPDYAIPAHLPTYPDLLVLDWVGNCATPEPAT